MRIAEAVGLRACACSASTGASAAAEESATIHQTSVPTRRASKPAWAALAAATGTVARPPGHMVVQSADHQDHAAGPHPPHQRIDGDREIGPLGAIDRAGVDDVEILAQVAPDPDLGRRLEGRLPEAVDVLALFRRDDARALPSSPHLERWPQRPAG